MVQMTRDEKAAFVQKEILTTEESCQLLGRTRQQLINCAKKGLIAPVKVTTNGKLYLKDDVINLKIHIETKRNRKKRHEVSLKQYEINEDTDVIPGQMRLINTDMEMEEE